MSNIDSIHTAIAAFSKALFDQNSLDDIATELVINCISQLDLDYCSLYIVDNEHDVLIQKAHRFREDNVTGFDAQISIPVGKGIVGKVASSGKPMVVADDDCVTTNTIRHSQIVVPVVYQGKIIGVIDSKNSKRNLFTQNQLPILQKVAELVATKIAKAISEQHLWTKTLLNSTKNSDYKLIAMQSQLNPHFTFNSLNVIMSMIYSKENDEAAAHLLKFSKLLRTIIKNSDQIYITLDEQLEMLKNYLDFEKSRFEEKLDLIFDVDPWIDLKNIKIPYLFCFILAEMAVHNTVKYGSPAANHIIVQIKRDLNCVKIVIECVFGLEERAFPGQNSERKNHVIFESPMEVISSLIAHFPHIDVRSAKQENESFRGEIYLPLYLSEHTSIF
jgi:two-component system, LytTR family, sensor kinase